MKIARLRSAGAAPKRLEVEITGYRELVRELLLSDFMTSAGTAARKRVLLIDDDACVLRTLCRCLSRSFEVTGVQSAEMALELLGDGARFDVIICDYQLEGSLSGIQFYETVKSDYPDQIGRVVIMSGGTASLADSAFATSLRSRWLTKPFSLAELESVLQRFRPSSTARTARPSHSPPPL